MLALLLAIQWVEDLRPIMVVIGLDSRSALASLHKDHSDIDCTVYCNSNTTDTLQNSDDRYKSNFSMGSRAHWGDVKLNGGKNCKKKG